MAEAIRFGSDLAVAATRYDLYRGQYAMSRGFILKSVLACLPGRLLTPGSDPVDRLGRSKPNLEMNIMNAHASPPPINKPELVPITLYQRGKPPRDTVMTVWPN